MGHLRYRKHAAQVEPRKSTKGSAAIAEERDALKAAETAAPLTSTSLEPQAEELERLRQEKVSLEQAFQERRRSRLYKH
jgi:hypothetical protein